MLPCCCWPPIIPGGTKPATKIKSSSNTFAIKSLQAGFLYLLVAVVAVVVAATNSAVAAEELPFVGLDLASAVGSAYSADFVVELSFLVVVAVVVVAAVVAVVVVRQEWLLAKAPWGSLVAPGVEIRLAILGGMDSERNSFPWKRLD